MSEERGLDDARASRCLDARLGEAVLTETAACAAVAAAIAMECDAVGDRHGYEIAMQISIAINGRRVR